MNKFVPYRERLAMLNTIVKATGCCGTGDGVEVIGELTQISPYAVVTVEKRNKKGFTSRQLYMVTNNSIEPLEVTDTGIKNVTLPL